MTIKSLDASNAYAQALKSTMGTAGGASGIGSDASSGAGTAFSSLVENSIQDVATATKQSEITGAQAIAGNADMVDVVTAVSNAELMVNTVVSVRDKVISAYNDILKMPI